MTTTTGRRGDGTLWIRTDAAGRDSWYGKAFVNGRQIKRRLGPVRVRGSREGLTKARAAAALRALHTETAASVPRDRRLDVAEAGDLYLHHLETVKGLKPTTLTDYRTILRGHLAPFLAGRTVDRVTPEDMEAYRSAKLSEGLKAKTVRNHLTFAGGLFRFATRRGWALANPVADVDMPSARGQSREIRFLSPEELAALYRAAPDDDDGADLVAFWPTDRVLFMTGAMTGLRQGELVGLRWRDIDWTAGVVRVRQSFTHGAWSTPKSDRSSRAVPLADALAGELERHHRASSFTGDDDLVFAHPTLGTVLDASALRRRFTAALERAGLRRVRPHDLRHSFGTAMAAAGAPMRTIQAWMGHASMSTTEVYADYAPDPTGGAAWAQRAFGETPSEAHSGLRA